MKLHTYLSEYNTTIKELSQQMECTRVHLSNVVRGKTKGGKRFIREFQRLTNGMVDIIPYVEKQEDEHEQQTG